MAVPAIKGTGFASAAGDLLALVERGRIGREELEARLERRDLEILDAKILPGEWVPIDTYGRVLELLGAVEGQGSDAYHLKRGAVAAERILGAGIYHQLESADRIKGASSDEEWRDRVGPLMLTVAPALFNFMKWKLERDPVRPGRFTVEVSEAAALPEAARLTIQGFIECTAAKILEAPVRVVGGRPSPDRIVYDCTLVG